MEIMMMTTIRHNTFETNSSSCHSITWTNHFKINESTLYTNGDGEYGWGYDELTTPIKKLDYCIVALHYISDYFKDDLDELVEYFYDKGITIELGDDLKNGEVTGYIDHQSTDILNGQSKPSQIFDIVMNPKCKIIIDNDNH